MTTTRKKILEALSTVTIDQTPTPERQEKSQFSCRDNVWRVRTIAERLYGTERITQDEYNACQRWAATYVLTYDGVGTTQDGASTSLIKHDAISFAMHMAGEKDCIPEIKARLGIEAHKLLELSLYHCYSSAQIARMVLPGVPHTTAESAVDSLCKKVYRDLYGVYLKLQKVNKKTGAKN